MMKTLVLFFMTLSVCALAMPSTRSYNRDHYRNGTKETNVNYEIMSQADSPETILGDVTVKIEGNKVCIYLKNIKLSCLNLNQACGIKVGPVTLGCAQDEEKLLLLCYKKCSLLAGPDYPLRTAPNTCAKDGCTSDEENIAGLCYPKCEQYYIGAGPMCWGRCDHFCGPDYSDTGLTCHRWIPAHTCYKPRYGRGVGTPPYKPWTNGMGCNGFGVDNKGECGKVDISGLLPVELGCNN